MVATHLFNMFEGEGAETWAKTIDYVKGLKSDNIREGLTRYFITAVSASNNAETNALLIDAIKAVVKDSMALKELDRRIAGLEKTKPGTEFSGFEGEDINGKPVNYNSLKGKLVYVDVWATWCDPCVEEIPAMKALQEEYKGKDVVFVSLSVDRDKEEWKKMVAEKKMEGLQLHLNLVTQGEFVTNNDITSIPRFFLIGKDGKIIDIAAPRPSNAKIKELINANL